MTDLPLALLHGFGLEFLWSVLTCVGCVVAVLVMPDAGADEASFAHKAVLRTFAAAIVGIIVFGAGTVASGVWSVFGMVFGGAA